MPPSKRFVLLKYFAYHSTNCVIYGLEMNLLHHIFFFLLEFSWSAVFQEVISQYPWVFACNWPPGKSRISDYYFCSIRPDVPKHGQTCLWLAWSRFPDTKWCKTKVFFLNLMLKISGQVKTKSHPVGLQDSLIVNISERNQSVSFKESKLLILRL